MLISFGHEKHACIFLILYNVFMGLTHIRKYLKINTTPKAIQEAFT